jgi:cell division protein DivIC
MASNRERHVYRKANICGVVIVAVICAVICGVTFFGGRSIAAQNASYAAKESELQSRIDAESDRAEEIEDYSRYVDSDEFAEKMAREKFGLVKEDEIVIKSEQ